MFKNINGMMNIGDLRIYDKKTSFAYFLSFFRHKIDHEKIKQIDIAREVGVRAEYINRVYKGRQTCSFEVQERICRFLGISYLEALANGKSLINANESDLSNKLSKPQIIPNSRRGTDNISVNDIVTVLSHWSENNKKTEDSLLKLQNIIENMNDCVVILDTDLIIEYQNRSHREMFGANLIGEECAIAHGCEISISECPSKISKKTGMAASAEFSYSKGVVSALVTPIRDHSGVVTGYVTIIRDISERLKIMAMSEQALEMLEQAVLIYDDNLKIRFYNRKFKEITGADNDDLETIETYRAHVAKNNLYSNYDKVLQVLDKARKYNEEAILNVHFNDGKTYRYSSKPMYLNEMTYIGRMVTLAPS